MTASKQTNKARPPKVELGMKGMIIGVAVGMVAGLGIEITTTQKPLVMQLSGLAGFAVGLLVETIRLWWRKRKRRESQKASGSIPRHLR